MGVRLSHARKGKGKGLKDKGSPRGLLLTSRTKSSPACPRRTCRHHPSTRRPLSPPWLPLLQREPLWALTDSCSPYDRSAYRSSPSPSVLVVKVVRSCLSRATDEYLRVTAWQDLKHSTQPTTLREKVYNVSGENILGAHSLFT